MIKFAVILLTTVAAVALGSLLWPKFTSSPRPGELQKVHDVVLETQLGQKTADVLSVTNEANVKPINLSAEVASVGNSIVTGLAQKATQVAAQQAAATIINQYHQLPPPVQQELQKSICQP